MSKLLSKLEYLKQYSGKSTVRVHKSTLKMLFKEIYNKTEPLESLVEKYLEEKRDYKKDIENFLISLKELPPISARTRISALKIFLLENEVELPQRFWRKIRGRIKGSRPATLDKVPDLKEFKNILSHLPLHGRNLYLFLESSGSRIGETLQLKLEDIELDKDPAQINIRGEYTKTGNPRVSFISSEAKALMLEWLKVRENYLKSASGKSHLYEKSEFDSRVFPFEDTTARHMWNSALRKTKNGQRDKKTNRYRLHPHVLRKYFRTRLGAVIPVDVVEALMGHEGYLTEVYRRYTVEDLAKFYKKGEHALLVFTEAAEVGKLRVEIEERNKQLQTLVNGLTSDNMRQKSQIEKLEGKMERIERILKDFQEKIGE